MQKYRRHIVSQYGLPNIDKPITGEKLVVPGTAAWKRAVIDFVRILQGFTSKSLDGLIDEHEYMYHVNFEPRSALKSAIHDLLKIDRLRQRQMF